MLVQGCLTLARKLRLLKSDSHMSRPDGFFFRTFSLSDCRKVRGQPIAARPKTVPDVAEVVPLVEFIFYYKSKGRSIDCKSCDDSNI